MATLSVFVDPQFPHDLQNTFIPAQGKSKGPDEAREREGKGQTTVIVGYDGVCAICLDHIELQETALIKGCEHAYCVRCILQWASYYEHPKCPQCKHPFESLSVHRALDGSLHDYMLEESVCMLLRATWFTPSLVKTRDDFYDDPYNILYYQYQYGYDYEEEEDLEDIDDDYIGSSSRLRIGNRRWGDNGYVRGGRQEARPLNMPKSNDTGAASSPSHLRKQKSEGSSSHEAKKDSMGRRAKRALKREAADKAAAAKHLHH